MAPILPIDAANLASLSNAGAIGAWMLLPDDEDRRKRFIYHVGVLEGLDNLKAGRMPSDLAPGLVMMALEAFSRSDCEKHYNERAARGCGAGMILYNASLRIARGEVAPVTRAMREVEGAIWGRKSSASKHVNDAVWRIFRPVAHLWAAYIYFDGDSPEGMKDFPCAARDVPQFLAVAEGMRHIGETARAPRRKDTILKPGDSVRLSDDVLSVLPAGTLIIPQAS